LLDADEFALPSRYGGDGFDRLWLERRGRRVDERGRRYGGHWRGRRRVFGDVGTGASVGVQQLGGAGDR
jgi:hypothetical protein